MVKWTHVLTGFGAKCESLGAYMECGGVGVELEVGGRGFEVGGWALVHCRSICALCRKVVKISAVYVRNEWQNWISCEERGRWQAKEREG